MGNPTIWYYPDTSGTVIEIDLADVSDLEVSTEQFRTTAEGLNGSIRTTNYGVRHRLRLVRARFNGQNTAGEDLVIALRTLESHLKRGGRFGFALDKDKAWAAFLKTRYASTKTVLQTNGNNFFNTSATLVSTDIVVLQSANPEGTVEYARVSSLSGDKITLAAGLRNPFMNPPAVIRHRDFYPVMQLNPASVDGSIITTDQRYNYTLDIDAVEDVDSLFKYSGFAGQLTGSSSTSGSRSLSLDTAIKRAKEGVGLGVGGDDGGLPKGTRLNR